MPNPDLASERREFEAKVKAGDFPYLDSFDLRRMNGANDMYVHMPAEMAWQGWLARSAIPTVVSEEMVEICARAMAENAGFDWRYCAQTQWKQDAEAGLTAALTVSQSIGSVKGE